MKMMIGLFIPFIGTILGAACVFFIKNEIKDWIQRALLGFASGVMVAASVWSLLIPSIEMSEKMGRFSFVPAVLGFFLGIFFLFVLDKIIPHFHMDGKVSEGPKTHLSNTTMLMLAVTLHNIPEGMAVGVVFASIATQSNLISTASAFALAIGIAIQNFPEGAIISLPFKSEGNSKKKSFMYGAISGVVEPIFAGLTIAASEIISIALPYFLSFAAGAMIFVVVEELIPEATADNKTDICTIGFAIGFALMMVLDVSLG